jgi:hypothetical protein
VRSFHNILGEHGQRLTILSLLPSLKREGAEEVEECPVEELPGRMYQIAGGEEADILAAVTLGKAGDVTVSDHQELRALVDQLVHSAEAEGAQRAEIHFIDADDIGRDDDGSALAASVKQMLVDARASGQTVAVLGVVLRADPEPAPA